MRNIERDALDQFSGGNVDFFGHLVRTLTDSGDDEPDRWVYEDMAHNAAYDDGSGR